MFENIVMFYKRRGYGRNFTRDSIERKFYIRLGNDSYFASYRNEIKRFHIRQLT